jgi:outer membrane lipoprotein-sorting protein
MAMGSLNHIQAETAEEKGLRIAKMADASDHGFGDFKSKITMTLKNKQGQTSVREMRSSTLEGSNDGDKTMIIFDSPRDVKGSAVLTWTHKVKSDDQWLYLPALKRVKRIASRNKSGPFMGSEFAYEDLASQEIEKYSYKFLREEKLNGSDCYVIERDPVDKYSGYSTLETWIHKERLTPEKVVFRDRKNSLLKTLTMEGYKQYQDKHWRADRFFMVNHQKGKETTLEWKEYQFKNGLNDKDFHQNSLKRAR